MVPFLRAGHIILSMIELERAKSWAPAPGAPGARRRTGHGQLAGHAMAPISTVRAARTRARARTYVYVRIHIRTYVRMYVRSAVQVN